MFRLLIAMSVLVHSLSFSSIVVDTKAARFTDKEIEEMKRHVRQELEKKNLIEFETAITSEYIDFMQRKSYRATVDTKFNVLTDEPALIRLKIPIETLLENSPSEKMLSSYAQTWAYKYSEKNGPNCWHTSMASIFLGWTKHRYMGPKEYSCHLKTHFTPIEKPEKWGDMIAFDSSSNSPIHGLTYLGPDRLDPKKIIVFTKNGYAQSKYLFMTLDDVKAIYSPKYVRYYRPNKDVVVDPSEDPKAPCANAMRGEAHTRANVNDPILDYILSNLGI